MKLGREWVLPGVVFAIVFGLFGLARATEFGPPAGWRGPLHELRDRLEERARESTPGLVPELQPSRGPAAYPAPAPARPVWGRDGTLACSLDGATGVVRGGQLIVVSGEGVLAAGPHVLRGRGSAVESLVGDGPTVRAEPLLDAPGPVREIVAGAHYTAGLAAVADGVVLFATGEAGLETWALPLGAAHLAVDPGRTAAVVAVPGDAGPQLVRVDLSTGDQLALGPGDWPLFAVDGTLLWLESAESGWSLRSDRGLLVDAVVPGPLSTAGRWVAAVRDGPGSTVTLVKVDGSAAVDLDVGVPSPREPAFLGDRLAFVTGASLHVVPVD